MLKTLLILLMVFSSSAAFAATSGTLFMDGNGNYGVGTTSPTNKLEVSGGTIAVLNANSMRFYRATNDAYNEIWSAPAGLEIRSSNGALTFDSSNDFIVNTWNGSAYTEKMRLQQSSGNVGIGTAVPLAKLAVAGVGTTTARAFEIDNNLYSPKVVVLDNGNVGIGTVLPVAVLAVGVGQPAMPITGSDLYVKGNLEVDGKIYGDGSALTGISGSISGLSAGYVPRASASITIVDSVIYQNAAGLVGIGTIAPVAKLNVADNSYTSGEHQLLRMAAVDGSAGITIAYEANGALGTGGILRSVGAVPLYFGTYSNSKHITLIDSGNVGIGTAVPRAKLAVAGVGTTTARAFEIDDNLYNPKVVVLDNGNVGIGSTIPSTTLQIKSIAGNGVVIGGTEYPPWMGTDGLYVVGSFRANTYLVESGGAINWGASQARISGYNPSTGSDTYLLFYTGGISANRERMRISDDGNVGIGTAVPRAKLAVAGVGTTTARALEIDDNLYNPKVIVLDNGNVGIGTVLPVAVLAVGVGQPNAMSITGSDLYVKGNIEVDGKIYGDGSGLTGVAGVSGLTATRVPVALNSTTIIDSGIYYVGGNVGINTTSPIHPIEVKTLSVANYVPVAGFFAPNNTTAGNASQIRFGVAPAWGDAAEWRFIYKAHDDEANRLDFGFWGYTEPVMSYLVSGNVGIGTTVPMARLAVVGTGSTTGRAFEIDNNVYNPKVVILDNGNVGIGTTAPERLLTIRQPADNNGILIKAPLGSGYPNNQIKISTDETYPFINEIISTGRMDIGSDDSQLFLRGTDIYPTGNFMITRTGDATSTATQQGSMSIGLQSNLWNGGAAVNLISGIKTLPSTTVNLLDRMYFVLSATGGSLTDGTTVMVLENTGNVGIGSYAPLAKLQVGLNPNITAGSLPAVAVKGNLVVDGKIYGNGSALTGISGAISGLTATRVPVANSSTTLVDSVIYQNSGNIGIGSTLPDSLVTLAGSTAGDGGADNGKGSILHIRQNTTWSANQPWALFVQGYSYLGGFRINAADGTRSLLKMGTGGILGFATEYPDTPIIFTQHDSYERMRIAIGGNLGIGTTVPLAKLAVVGVGTTTGRAFEIDDNLYNPKVIVLDNGNVGIGTTELVAALTVNGRVTTKEVNIDDGTRMEFRADSTNMRLVGMTENEDIAVVGLSSVGVGIDWNNNATTDYFAIWHNVLGRTEAAELFRVQEDGNVGIGTIEPLAKLTIGTPANATGAMSTTLASYAGDLGTTAGNTINLASFGFGPSNTTALGIRGYRTADDSTYLSTALGLGMDVDNGSFSTSQALWINNSGNIGIGTTIPQQKFEVRGGSILGSEYVVTAAATMTVDWGNGNQQYVVLNQAGHTVNFSSYKVGQVLRLIVCQDGTGSRTVTTWDTSIVWASGTAPTLTAGASKCDIVSFVCTNAKGTVKTFGTMVANF